MKILVTGATGFIGRRLCDALANQGNIVHALCRSTNHPLLVKHKLIIPFKGELSEPHSIVKAMKNCEQVYHTAALAKMCSDKNEYYNINVTGTKNVLETAMYAGVKKVVHTSSCGVIGPTYKYPMNEDDPRIMGFPIDYERTKFLAELLVKDYVKLGMNVVIVNPSRVYGEGPVTESNSSNKAMQQLGYTITSFEEGMKKTVQYYQSLN